MLEAPWWWSQNWKPGSSQVHVVLSNAKVHSPKSAVIISSQYQCLMVRLITLIVIMAGIDVKHVTSWTLHTLCIHELDLHNIPVSGTFIIPSPHR